MTTTFRSVIDLSKFYADLSTVGPGPHANERVTDGEWRILINAAINSVWRNAADARPDFQIASADFTLVSGNSASFQVPSSMHAEVDVVWSPDTTLEYSLGSFNWASRRSPGGWFPANFGGSTNWGGNSIRLMGDNIYVEPSQRAGGNYRLWYCPKAKNVRADSTVQLATTTVLPSCTASGVGFAKTLIAVANGALSVDSIPVVAGNNILVQNQANAVDNGTYSVLQPGTGGTPFILSRSNINVTTGTNGFMVYVSAGATNIDRFFETTSLTTVVDVTPWTWAEAFIDPIIEQFSELIALLTAVPAMLRDDDLDPKPLILRAQGPDGQSGLMGEMKSYFRQVRGSGTVSKILDTDNRGPRSWWT